MRIQYFGACVLTALATPVLGDVLLSNIAATVNPAGTFFGLGSDTREKTVGFTIGAQPFTLDTVRLSMNYSAGGTAVVSIWQGNGFPQTLVQTLTPPLQQGVGNFVFITPSTLTLSAGTTYWVYVESIPNPTASFMWEATSPPTVPTGAATCVGFLYNGTPSATLNRLEVTGTLVGPSCYANCDGSTAQPVLNANDFSCFLNKYAAGDAYANCDGSTVQPVLTANDFACFLDRYVAGCR